MGVFEPEVFVSYAWGGESEQTVDALVPVLAAQGIHLIRDKKDLAYKGSITAFEQRIGDGQCVILVISDKYLRSQHCMYELVEAAVQPELQRRIFPIVLPDADIYRPAGRMAYLEHWDNRIAELNAALKQTGSLANTGSLTADLDLYTRIRSSLDGLLDVLKDMNTLTPELHRSSGYESLIAGLRLALFGPPSPYMGLRAFDAADSGRFFGRETLTAALVKRLWTERFLAVVGASGSGKSSVVRAGILAALATGETQGEIKPPPGSPSWPQVVITPGAHPLASLAFALGKETGSLEPGAFQPALQAFLARHDANRVVLVVDQFEELFTECKQPAERQDFVDLLMGGVKDELPVTILLTLRADFYHRCAQYEALRAALEQHQAYIGAMSRDELRRAITLPAEQAGRHFEAGLVDVLLEDIGDEPGALPLLSHALHETWQHTHGDVLSLAAYLETGRVQGALAHSAQLIYDSLDREQQTLARGIFKRLTEPGEGVQDTRRRASLGELAPDEARQPDVEGVVKRLADAYLVTTGAGTVEVAHEALIREWPALRAWLDEDREALRTHRALTERAQEWAARQQDSSELYRGARLAQAQEWAKAHPTELNPQERDFLAASQAEEQREADEEEAQRQRELAQARALASTQRQRLFILGAGLALAVVLMLVALEFYRQAQINLQQAGISAVTATHALGLSYVRGTDAAFNAASAGQSAATAVAEAQVRATAQAEAEEQANIALSGQLSALAQTMDESQGQELLFKGLLLAEALQHAPNSQADEAARQMLGNLGQPLGAVRHQGPVSLLALRPDGLQAVSVGERETTAHVWDPQTGQIQARLEHPDEVTALLFHPDGQFIITGCEDGLVRFWSAVDGSLVSVFDTDAPVGLMDIHPAGNRLLTGHTNGMAIAWDISSEGNFGAPLGQIFHELGVNAIDFDPVQRRALSAGEDGTLRIWDVETGEGILDYFLQYDWTPITQAAFYPAGDLAAFLTEFGSLVLLDLQTSQPILEEALGTEDTQGGGTGPIFFDDSGYYLVTSYRNPFGSKAWFPRDGTEIDDPVFNSLNQLVAFDGSDWILLAGSQGGTASLLAQGGLEYSYYIESTFYADAPVLAVALCENGSLGLVGDAGGWVRAWQDVMEPGLVESFNTQNGILSPDSQLYAFNICYQEEVRETRSVCLDPVIQISRASGGYISHGPDLGETKVRTFSPDSQRFAAGFLPEEGGEADTLVAWEVASGEILLRAAEAGGVVEAVFSPNGSLLATISGEGLARVWDLSTGQESVALDQEGSDGVRALAFSPDGARLAGALEDGRIIFWETASGVQSLVVITQRPANALAFNLVGDLLAAAGSDGTVRLLDSASGAELRRFQYQGAAFTVQFSPDDTWLLTSGCDQASDEDCIESSVRVWDVAGGREVKRLDGMQPSGGMDAFFSPDGSRILITRGPFTGYLSVLWRPMDLAQLLCQRLVRNFTPTEWAQLIGVLPYHQTCPNLPDSSAGP